MSKIYIQRIDDKKGRIIVFREKPCNRYFLAETKEQVYDACLKILKERSWMFVEPEPPILNDTYNDMVFGPNSVLEKTRQMLVRENIFLTNSYEERLREYRLVRAALKEDRGDIAWTAISERCNYEYEGYEFEYLENV